jgi:hypothetical protein
VGNCFETNWGIILKLIGDFFWYYLGILPETRHKAPKSSFFDATPPSYSLFWLVMAAKW